MPDPVELMADAIAVELWKAGVVVANIDPARAALAALEQAGYAVVEKEPVSVLVASASVRFAGYWERIQKRPDDDESPEMMRMCEQRDGLIGAIRSLDVGKLHAALDDSGIVGAPRKHPAADTAGPT